jgi:hypothetical protein
VHRTATGTTGENTKPRHGLMATDNPHPPVFAVWFAIATLTLSSQTPYHRRRTDKTVHITSHFFVPFCAQTYYTTTIHKIKANISTITIILCPYPDIRISFLRPINYTTIILYFKFKIFSCPTNPNAI